jgi:nucleoside-diphosphate-sugar epimerase
VRETGSILVTGGTGFVGRHVVRTLAARGTEVRLLTRSAPEGKPSPIVPVAGTLEDVKSFSPALSGCSSVIHLAARAHVVRERDHDPIAALRKINTAATLAIALEAKAAGVRSFVFVSSIGVNGESTDEGQCFGPTSPPAPVQPYAVSKYEAERALTDLAGPDFKVIVVRPPLVYGAGAPGNFRRLIKLVRSGLPLPLGRINNRRSLIGVESLSDLLVRCLDMQAADFHTLLVSDAIPISTTGIIDALAQGLEVRPPLFTPPGIVLSAAAKIPKTRHVVRQLFGSLCIDPRTAAGATGWTPTLDTPAGLAAMAQAFRKSPW